ncbi:DUF418 domain-containing protein [Streptomyces axinellae]|uniref:DUF418 domain-containing protein n=1 Tax=Streptomyces axinellae TaxID=552788 RepID=UPI0031D7F0EB
MNVEIMTGPYSAGAGPSASMPDQVAAWLVTALVSGKFYLLFAFLFGYSFTLQARAAERDGAGFAARHLRRVLCLFLLGLAHAVLLFPGDILMTYAVLGLVLFAVRNVTPRKLVRAAVWLVVALSAVLLARGLAALGSAAAPADAAGAADSVAAYRGDPMSVVHTNLEQWRLMLGGDFLYAPHILAAFLLGLAAGKHRVLAEPHRYRGQMIRLLRYGLPLGLAGGAFAAVCGNGPLDPRWSDIGMAVEVLTAPALTGAYVSALVLVLGTRRGRRLGGVLAPAGRMALTNYLTQSLVMALVFTGYGLALYGRAATAAVLAGSCVLYVAQVAVSNWLMRQVRYGPVERLLHTVTRGRTG